MRSLIPARDVQLGQRLFVRPRDGQTVARDATTGRSFPADGCVVQINAYVVGCLQRGSLMAFGDDAQAPIAESQPIEPQDDHQGEDV